MKSKKIIALSIVVVLIVSLFATAVPASATSGPVQLIYAKPVSGVSTKTMGYVEVENIGYAKNVTIHYTYDNQTWKDVAATYVAPTQGNYEAWQFTTEDLYIGYRGAMRCTFAIKYEVNGQTYWDNNGGNNYFVCYGYGVSGEAAFGSANVCLGDAYAYVNALTEEKMMRGNIQLVNLAYDKDVKVRYTIDNWETYEEVSATYGYTGQNNGNECWYFETTLDESAEDIYFAVSYTANDVTYWDNNFGANYHLTIAS